MARPPGRGKSRFQWRKERNWNVLVFSSHFSEWSRKLPFETETSTREDGILEVPGNGAQRVVGEHSPDHSQFLLGLSVVDAVHEGDSLSDGKISPVDSLGRVHIIWAKEIVEDLGLAIGILGVGQRGVVIASLGTVRSAYHAHVGWIMVLVLVK